MTPAHRLRCRAKLVLAILFLCLHVASGRQIMRHRDLAPPLQTSAPSIGPLPGIPLGIISHCAPLDPDKIDAAKAASAHDVPSTLLEHINSVMAGNASNWLPSLASHAGFTTAPVCNNLGSTTCTIDDSLCRNDPSTYWMIHTAVNFFSYVSVTKDAFRDAWTETNNDLDRIALDFPIQVPEAIVANLRLLQGLAAAFGMLGGIAGLGNTVVGAGMTLLGGLINLISQSLPARMMPGATTAALHERISQIYAAITDNMDSLLEAVFVDGDLSNFTAALSTTAEYGTTPAALFADGNFFYGASSLSHADLAAGLARQFKASLAGVALVEANYYILKDAYPATDGGGGDGCPTAQTGRVVGGSCFTLEMAGPGSDPQGGNTRDRYSVQNATAAAVLASPAYGVALEDVYRSSYACQAASNAYGAALILGCQKQQLGSAAAAGVPDCFFNLPVFYVGGGGGDQQPSSAEPYDASPCRAYRANQSAGQDDKPQAGVTYLPDNLQFIFGQAHFCDTGCRLSPRACYGVR